VQIRTRAWPRAGGVTADTAVAAGALTAARTAATWGGATSEPSILQCKGDYDRQMKECGRAHG